MEISSGACILGAMWLLTVPVSWTAGLITAISIHEISHWLAAKLMGCRIGRIRLSLRGVEMEIDFSNATQEAFCALAGPLGSFALLPLAHRFPECALCALGQGFFNLIPVYPLDGGRIMRAILPQQWSAAIEVFALIMLCGLAIYTGVRYSLGIVPGIPWLLLLLRRKIPCKESKIAVQ